MRAPGAPVYVVDDDESIREAVAGLIRSAGWAVETFASAREFLSSPRRAAASCLVLDVQLPDLNGLELQRQLAAAGTPMAIIFLTAHGNIPMSVRAIKAGALEFLTKPVDEEELLEAIRQGLSRFEEESRPPRSASSPPMQDGIVGVSTALRTVLEQVGVVAPTESTVLILGETGTGKELVARAIHRRSSRSNRPFVDVNCAAIPSGLVASELFGHEKGAFTGALQRRVGRFEMAERGTIFLDEIGDLPAETQVTLLRVLQERQVERVGGVRSVPVDVRVVTATNRDLPASIAAGSFRSDLYYRLNVFPIELPPLRARRDDIPPLVQHFVERFSTKLQKKIAGVTPRALDVLMAYDWPGNIRELQNVIERAAIVCDGEYLSIDERRLASKAVAHDAPDRRTFVSARGTPLTDVLANQEKAAIEAALAETGGLVSGPSGAAAMLGVPPSTLESKIRSLSIDKRRFKTVYQSRPN